MPAGEHNKCTLFDTTYVACIAFEILGYDLSIALATKERSAFAGHHS